MATISQRIKEALDIRNMKQNDLVQKTGIGKSSISTYISGDWKPKQENLCKIAEALNVNEAWLMGMDVPMERTPYSEFVSSYSIGFEITGRSLKHSPDIFHALCNKVKDMYSVTDNVYMERNPYEYLTDISVSYEEKAYFLNMIFDFVIYHTDTNQLQVFINPDSDMEMHELNKIIFDCKKLNEDGLRKISDYTSDILCIESYRKP